MIIRCGEYEHEGTPQELIEHERLSDEYEEAKRLAEATKDVTVNAQLHGRHYMRVEIDLDQTCTTQDVQEKVRQVLNEFFEKINLRLFLRKGEGGQISKNFFWNRPRRTFFA
ncbi:hypothetical protein H7K28_15125 [Paenibacillus polymyxa]|mgnify:CR=1 FL=1|jgi:hypothetical protein|uniref:hypothetical protein n=1 Tax=Paenibacillus polymyxa TaxID=1406 RepID=UPI00157FF361|nr:hypothetical protein [Paenibacillus polymyxa]MBY0024541.1 hypothetical protein [Paenibacillus polymyxa]MBY0058669.1 hypothetical protein [Paenibacillus polymyxa]MBY0071255.1 hypothetical protein [Paenibacillus polymyxa]MBY0078589.1 hypothetical protein [Paenibacillus polymyxa]MBZ6441708.1 hypothetical protein [Paenibacillus polymyxa]